MMKAGDLVTRLSYGRDLLFEIYYIDNRSQTAVLKGFDVRLLADAPMKDLVHVKKEDISRYEVAHYRNHDESMRWIRQQRELLREKNEYTLRKAEQVGDNLFELPGKVLHLDGDPKYLEKCLAIYKELNIPADGYHVQEKNMPDAVRRLLPQSQPDILVITGHDGLLKSKQGMDPNDLSSYRNSRNFMQAVQLARQWERNKDALTIIAGACQSHFEALIYAGANFASSPQRILIHALDPVLISEKVAYTSFQDRVNLIDVIQNTITGMEGIGGVESKGCYRLGFPRKKAAKEEQKSTHSEASIEPTA